MLCKIENKIKSVLADLTVKRKIRTIFILKQTVEKHFNLLLM